MGIPTTNGPLYVLRPSRWLAAPTSRTEGNLQTTSRHTPITGCPKHEAPERGKPRTRDAPNAIYRAATLRLLYPNQRTQSLGYSSLSFSTLNKLNRYHSDPELKPI